MFVSSISFAPDSWQFRMIFLNNIKKVIENIMTGNLLYFLEWSNLKSYTQQQCCSCFWIYLFMQIVYNFLYTKCYACLNGSCDEFSWQRTRDLLVEVATHGENTGYEVPCLIVAAKDDLDQSPLALQESTRVSLLHVRYWFVIFTLKIICHCSVS